MLARAAACAFTQRPGRAYRIEASDDLREARLQPFRVRQTVNIHRIYTPISRHFRTLRMRQLCAEFGLTPHTRVLDVGGSRFNWDLSPVRPKLTFLNIDATPRHPLEPTDTYVQGDGTRLPFADRSFDLVYSNSVIEHLGTAAAQAAFAREVRRVGARYYVQTPNRRFPVEPHLLAFGVHWLPHPLQRRLIRRASVWGWVARPTAASIDAFLAEVRLLDRGEMATLFPDATLWTERVAGLSKSFVAVKRGA